METENDPVKELEEFLIYLEMTPEHAEYIAKCLIDEGYVKYD